MPSRIIRHFSASMVLLLLLIASLPVQAAPNMAVSFTRSEVIVSGATPKGSVVLIGLARVPRGYYSSLETFHEILEDADGDGTVRYDTKSNAAWKSIWGVVDLATGQHIVARPDRSPGRQVEFHGRGLGRAANGTLSKLEHEGQWLEMMLVKPAGDVFRAVVVDGGPLDEDGRNDNVIHASMDGFELARGKASKPDQFHIDDVLFVIDPDNLTMVVVRVK